MPIKWKSKILLAALEGTYGVDAAPTGANHGILATQITLQSMEGQDVSRDLELPWLAAQATIATGLHTRITFRVELVGSGTAGEAPAWSPLLQACAVLETIDDDTVTYTRHTDSTASATLHLWVGPTRYVLRGARGNAVLRLNAQGIAVVEFSFTGLFSLPTDEDRPNVDLSRFLRPKVVSHANTPAFSVSGIDFVMRNYSFDLGNDVQTRFLVGSESVRIVDSPGELVTFQIEAVAAGIYSPEAAALNDEDVPIVIQHESDAGRTITITHPTTQPQRPGGLINQQNLVEWSLRHVPLPVNGDDQWSIVLS